MITAFGNLDTAVRAMEGGAFDYLVKPFDLDQAAAVITRALDAHRGRHELASPQPSGGPGRPVRSLHLIGHSPPMQELFKQIALVAPTDVPVLITGESGTGKELVARAIHRHSPRGSRTFLPVCLAALSQGLVERELFGHLARLVHRARSRIARGCSSWPKGGRCCWTRSATFPRPSRSSCCARSSTARSRPWATLGPVPSTSASWPRPTGRWAS